ncbi:ribonuclease T2 [Rhizodiscina lignyota]|uniref:Ribonuclease T2-like n=1 Tax=Rhizodiscina lignyota TaxID=1504668 RepID=A0A9P4IQW0_9PEZI|nr:ribonuclease T2 [Rhizodiscina lignyota]
MPLFPSYPGLIGRGSPETCSNTQLSCHNTTVVQDLCCFNAPGGQLLQTQFWDTDPSTGPSNSWTVHGLWPDHCDGTFDSTCDTSREYTDISGILTSFGKTDLLSFMNTYWKDISGDDESFWEHEWAKHGTCVSTLDPTCYTDYQSKQEVPDFFQKAVDLFQSLPTYDWLSAAGITPSTTKTYSASDIQAALSAKHGGHQVTIGCSSGALDEVWYHYNVQGSVQTGTFVAADPDGTKSTCPDTGIKYLPKSGSSTGGGSTTTTSSSGGSQPTGGSGTPFSGNGFLEVTTGGSQKGCLISAGTWFTTGTCATFTATASGNGFTLKSSKGNCGISNNAFTCGSNVSSTVFTSSGGSLAAGGSTGFFADSVPSGSTQATVFTTSHDTSLTITWSSQ